MPKVAIFCLFCLIDSSKWPNIHFFDTLEPLEWGSQGSVGVYLVNKMKLFRSLEVEAETDRQHR